jgi:hypothetical protein
VEYDLFQGEIEDMIVQRKFLVAGVDLPGEEAALVTQCKQ